MNGKDNSMKRLTVLLGALVAFTFAVPKLAHSQVFFTATIDSSNQVPVTVSGATGTAWAVLNPGSGTLTYQITYADLDSTFLAAHFHYGAPGANGPVVMPITTWVGNTANGTWSDIPDSVIAAMMKGDIYINIHSQKYPGGEIRGQLEPAPDFGISMSLNGAQDVPALSVTGTGTGYALFEPDTNLLVYRVTVAGLSSTLIGSHFHYAPSGDNGPIAFPFNMNVSDSTATGEWAFPDSLWMGLVANGLYVNIHTSKNPSGEIRGQFTLEPSNSIFLQTVLNAQNQVPPSNSKGTGTSWMIMAVTPAAGGYYPTAASASLTYRITYADLDSTFTAAHFHYGTAGNNGPVVFPVTTWIGNTAQGTWSGIPDTIVDALLDGGMYQNIHSKKYPAGELRGQVERADGIPFAISLSSNQSVPPIYTTGTGTGWAILDTTGSNVDYNITVASLSSNLFAAHFHLGDVGVNGPIAEPLTYTDSTASGTWTSVPDTLLPDLLDGGMYANFHTTDHPAGEIRGQLELDNGILTAIKTVANNGVPTKFELAQNYPNPFNPSTVISFTLPQKENVRLDVYNILGQRVARLFTGSENAGTYDVRFDGSKYASGVYFYRLSAGNLIQVKKMMLLK